MKRLMMNTLLKWKKSYQRKPLILKGVRQVGKTYLLQSFGKNYFPKYHYFNFEQDEAVKKIFAKDLVPKRLLQELSFYSKNSIQVGKDLVIFDEIQECPRALTSLKYFYEEYPELHLCAAGSLLGIHLASNSFPVGKVTFETLRPMNFEEFLVASDSESAKYLNDFESLKNASTLIHEHLLEKLKHYYIVGGLPDAISVYCEYQEDLLRAFELVRKRQKDLLNAYYADIAKHSGKINAMHIDRIFRAIPAQLSQSQDESIKRFKFKGVIPSVTHYSRLAGAIDWLEATGMIAKVCLIHQAQVPFKAYVKENFFKLLLFDVGMLGCMTDLPIASILDQDYGSYKGYFAENFVAQEFLASGFEQLFCWESKQYEIDYLFEIKGNLVPVEVKSGKINHCKSLQFFEQKYHPKRSLILSAKPYKKEKKTSFLPLYLAGHLFSKDEILKED